MAAIALVERDRSRPTTRADIAQRAPGLPLPLDPCPIDRRDLRHVIPDPFPPIGVLVAGDCADQPVLAGLVVAGERRQRRTGVEEVGVGGRFDDGAVSVATEVADTAPAGGVDG